MLVVHDFVVVVDVFVDCVELGEELEQMEMTMMIAATAAVVYYYYYYYVAPCRLPIIAVHGHY